MKTTMLPGATDNAVNGSTVNLARIDAAYAMFAAHLVAQAEAEESDMVRRNRTLHVLDVRNAAAEMDRATVAPGKVA